MEEEVKKQYLLNYVLRPDIAAGEEDLQRQKEAISNEVQSAGGKVEASLCQEGTRRLSYPIENVGTGYVCEIAFSIDPASIGSLRDSLKHQPAVLRYLLELKRPTKARKIKPAREARLRAEEDGKKSTRPEAPQQEERDKVSIKDLDKRLEEIIKNI